MRHFNIVPTDKSIAEAVQHKIDYLNKPRGSLGRLETLALQLCIVQHTLEPHLSCPSHIVYGADHGISDEHVSVSPKDVTWQMMINFTRGGAAVNMFCRQHGFRLHIVDMGVDYDLTPYDGIINRKIARGTSNFLYADAMTCQQFDKAISTGVEMAERCHAEGCNIICIGEMGISNTSPSSIWMSLMGNIDIDRCVGAGAGLSTAGRNSKLTVLSRSIDRFKNTHPTYTTEDIMRCLGGFEMVAAVGTMLRAAELGMIIMVDGFIMSACMLAASKMYPAVLDYAVFGHCGDESGHRQMLSLMHAEPLLQLGFRLGEGTGALCAYPIIDSAVRMINEMGNFDNANISKYF